MYNLSDLPTFLHRKSVGFLGDVDPREEAIFMKVAMKFFSVGLKGSTEDFKLVGDVDPHQRVIEFLSSQGESRITGYFPPEARVLEGDRVITLKHPLGLRGSDWELVLY